MAAGKQKIILVTGYDGFIGAVLVEKLLLRGYHVKGIDAGYFRDCAWTAPVSPTESITKDIRDVIADDVDGAYALIHLAALSNDAMGQIDPQLTLDINFAASVRLARLAKSLGVSRFLFSSSCSIYGVNAASMATEQAPMNPQTAYALSKVKSEEAIAALADDAFSPTFLRNGTAYGFSPKLRFDLVLNNLVGWAMTTGEIRLMSDGSAWRPLIHVDDIAEAFIAALEAPRDAIHNQVLNIGHDRENYRVRGIAETVGQIVPGCQIVYADGASPDTRSYKVDFSKARRILPAFQPQWNIERGARRLYEMLRAANPSQEELVDAFSGRRFTRLKQLEHLISSGAVGPDLFWVPADTTRRTPGAF